MTRYQIKERVPVLQAWLEQKAIQFRPHDNGPWIDFDIEGQHPNIFAEQSEWRIKPEPPKPREWWIEFAAWNNAIQVHTIDPFQMDGRHTLVHVREVLSSEPETSEGRIERYLSKRPQPKDLAAPPDQQP